MPPKDKKKEKPAGWDFDIVESGIILIIILSLATTLVPALIKYVTSGEISFYGFKLAFIFEFFKNHIQFFKTLGFIVAGVAAISTFIFIKKGDAVWQAEKAKLYPENMPSSFSKSSESVVASDPIVEKWKKIVEYSESENSANWRLAVIEADIMLDDLLTTLQLPGETMGDKLKAVESSDFITIDLAWEAHKARNMIAHEGGDFLLNQREARRLISLYRAVFKEFRLI